MLAALALVAALQEKALEAVPFQRVRLADGFFAPRIETNRKVTIPACLAKCEETGRIRNFAVAGGLADAWSPLRAGRDRCSHRRVPLASDRSRSARPRPRCEARPPPCAPRAPWKPSR
jgi:hypothetical protein